MTQEANHRLRRLEPLELTRQDLLKYGLSAGATVVFLGSCGGDDKSAKSSTVKSAAVPKNKPEKLTVRTFGDPYREFFDRTAGADFTAETGIPVEWDTTDTAELMTRVRAAIGADQRPPVDAVYGESVQGYLASVQKLSQKFDPKIATVVADATQAVVQPGSGIPDWAMLGLYTFSGPFNYRKDKVNEKDVSSWLNLWGPKFHPKTVGVGTQYYFNAFPVAKAIGVTPTQETSSMDPVWAKYEELRPNLLGLLNDTQITQFLISGECYVCPAFTANGEAAAKEGAPIGFAVPKEGMCVDRDFFWMFNNLPPEVQYYTNVLANHWFSAKTQTAMAAELGVVPASPEAKLPAKMEKNPVLYPRTEEQLARNIILPIPLAAKHVEDWQASYEEALK